MKPEKNTFEKEGLKMDKERVLTYSQLSCPFDCTYCFVEDMNFNQRRNVSYLSERQFELMEQLPEEIELVMLGCDTEFFSVQKRCFVSFKKIIRVR